MASDQSMNIKEYQGENDDTIIFSSKVHLLAGKLVPVVPQDARTLSNALEALQSHSR